MQEQWTAVDRYLTDLLVPPDPALEAALQASNAAGLPAIQVPPNLGKLLLLVLKQAKIPGPEGPLSVSAGDGPSLFCSSGSRLT